MPDTRRSGVGLLSGEILDASTWQLPARYVGAIAGSIGVLIFSSRLRSPRIRKFLMFCGESTILILVWHFLSFKLLTYILINIHGLPASELTAFPVHKGLAIHYWPMYVLFGLVIPLGIQISYNTIKKKLTDTGSDPLIRHKKAEHHLLKGRKSSM